VALTYRATVDVPARFRKSKAVGAVFGLTPSKYQSGESDRTGRISRCGDDIMRAMLYEAAQSMLVRSTDMQDTRPRERNLVALHPFDCRTGAYVEPIGCLAP